MEDPHEGLRGTGHGRRRLRRGLEGASMRLIGISGLKTSGKDTCFKAIASALPNQNVQRVAFADKLKELSAIALGFTGTPEQLIAYMDEAKEQWEIGIKQIDSLSVPFHRLTGRAYLQHIGQGARKVFADGFWVDQILPPSVPGHYKGADALLQDRYPGVDVLCVTDVRYPNEADRVHELGGVVWQIIRPGTESDGHSSEIPLESEKVDLSIYNGFNIPTLYEAVAEAVSRYACA